MATLGQHPNVVSKTGLDEQLRSSMNDFSARQNPEEVYAENSVFFRQERFASNNHVYEEHAGPGLPEEHNDGEEVAEATPLSANKKTLTTKEYKLDLPITRELNRDDQVDMVNRDVAELADGVMHQQIREAILRTYADGFDGNTDTTPDGNSLFNNSHTTVSGDTVDNLETGALSATNLATLIRSLRLQKDQRGENGGHRAAGLLVPSNLFGTAVEVTDSELKAGTGNNDVNFIRTKYGSMVLGVSTFLDSTYNTATNANTSYYLVGRNHHITRRVREGISTEFTPPRFSKQDKWIYRVRFSELSSPEDWPGCAASNGTA